MVLDNPNTHKPKEDRWLKAHPNVHLHFIPTHSSWLNQIGRSISKDSNILTLTYAINY